MEKITENINNTINNNMKWLDNHSIILIIIGIFLILYVPYVRPTLPQSVVKLFNDPLFRLFMYAYIIYRANHNISHAIITAFVFMLAINMINKNDTENFDNVEHFYYKPSRAQQQAQAQAQAQARARAEQEQQHRMYVKQQEERQRQEAALKQQQKLKSYTNSSYKSEATIIRLFQPANEYINLAQVKVYDTSNPSINRALNAKIIVKDASQRVAAHPLENLTNGKIANNLAHNNAGAGNYIDINLDRFYDIQRIVIYNRDDCCTNRATGMTVSVFKSTEEVNVTNDIKSSNSSKDEIYKSFPFPNIDGNSQLKSGDHVLNKINSMNKYWDIFSLYPISKRQGNTPGMMKVFGYQRNFGDRNKPIPTTLAEADSQQKGIPNNQMKVSDMKMIPHTQMKVSDIQKPIQYPKLGNMTINTGAKVHLKFDSSDSKEDAKLKRVIDTFINELKRDQPLTKVDYSINDKNVQLYFTELEPRLRTGFNDKNTLPKIREEISNKIKEISKKIPGDGGVPNSVTIFSPEDYKKFSDILIDSKNQIINNNKNCKTLKIENKGVTGIITTTDCTISIPEKMNTINMLANSLFVLKEFKVTVEKPTVEKPPAIIPPKNNTVNKAPDTKVDTKIPEPTKLPNTFIKPVDMSQMKADDLKRVNITEIDFSVKTDPNKPINMAKTDFSDSIIRKCNFRGVILEGSNFTNTYIIDSKFDIGIMNKCIMKNVIIIRSDFITTNLKDVDLSDASIHDSNFTDASLSGANLLNTKISNTQLDRTDFRKTTNLSTVNSTKNQGKPLLPDGFTMVNGIIAPESKAKEIEKNLRPINPNKLTSPRLVIKGPELNNLYIPYLNVTLVSNKGVYSDYFIAGVDINNSAYNKEENVILFDLDRLNASANNNSGTYEISEVKLIKDKSGLPMNAQIISGTHKEGTLLNIPPKTNIDVIYVKEKHVPVRSNKYKNMLIKIGNDEVKYI